MLKLHGSNTSPYVRHCRIAMLQEGLRFELVLTDYAASGANSPAKRVPFLKGDNGLFLTDSSAILHYIRTRMGQPFLASSDEAETYFMANTLLETSINLFLLEKDGLTDAPYLQRQRDRVETCFEALNSRMKTWAGSIDDGILRAGCLLSWINYRKRYDFSGLDALVRLDAELSQLDVFKETAPPPLT